MKGVVFLGDRKLELREFPDPTPGPRDVILEIKASGMCGTDLHTYRAPGGAVAVASSHVHAPVRHELGALGLPLVCTENLIRIDCVTESPNVNGDDGALLPLPDPVRLAVQVEEPT